MRRFSFFLFGVEIYGTTIILICNNTGEIGMKLDMKLFARRLYTKSTHVLLGEALVFALIGVLLLFSPVGFLTGIMMVLGGALALFGVFRMISGIMATREYGGGAMDILFGIMNLVIGLLFFAYPTGSLVGIMYIFIVLFLFQAIRTFIFAINMVRLRFGHYIFNLFIAILTLVLAIALMFYPLAGAVVAIMMLGAILLIYACVNVYMFWQLRQLKKKIESRK